MVLRLFLRYSSVLTLRAQTGEANIRKATGTGPPYQLCKVPQSTSVLTHTCSLTHTAITLSLCSLCGNLATVARITSVHTPHLAVSCWFVRVEKLGGRVRRKMHMPKSYYNTRSVWSKDSENEKTVVKVDT